MEPAITIHNLSKQYKLKKAAPYIALRDVISSSFKNVFKYNKEAETFWALKDIDLKIEQGERLGIVGANGAGKSTLLKIISRITPPTKGKVVLNGRVASLLEVGTGFHPELTGRENIYLNGSILGLTKKEIDSKLDEIIDFSGVEKFIDMPLKNYSSGMQLRLAFSVAAHLEPEILLIDEVLAVGDIEFQKKCIGKMQEISSTGGRTIVFVSHNTASVKQLCNKGLVLQKGEAAFYGPVQDAVNLYTGSFLNTVQQQTDNSYDLSRHPNKIRKDEGLMSATMLVNGEVSNTFLPGATLTIELEYFLKTKLSHEEIGVVIKNEDHLPLIGLNNKHLGQAIELRTGVASKASITIPNLNIYKRGKYYVDLYMGEPNHFYECLYDCFYFTLELTDVYHSGILPDPQFNLLYYNVQIKA